jgi:predicted nuclease of predicted toxin-antitoxin system
MKLFADECVYRVTVEALRAWGHDVVTTQEEGLAGKADTVQLARATEQGRVLITNDLDFSHIRRYPPADHRGVIVLKMRPKILSEVHSVLKGLLGCVTEDDLDRTLTVVDHNKYRMRRK